MPEQGSLPLLQVRALARAARQQQVGLWPGPAAQVLAQGNLGPQLAAAQPRSFGPPPGGSAWVRKQDWPELPAWLPPVVGRVRRSFGATAIERKVPALRLK